MQWHAVVCNGMQWYAVPKTLWQKICSKRGPQYVEQELQPHNGHLLGMIVAFSIALGDGQRAYALIQFGVVERVGDAVRIADWTLCARLFIQWCYVAVGLFARHW